MAGCAQAPAYSADPSRQRLTAVVLPYLTHVPYHIAQEEGFFGDEGLEVEFLRLGRSQEFMSALASGEVDVTNGMLGLNELNLIASGARVRVVASMHQLDPAGCTFVGVIARKELADSGVLDDPARIRELVFDTDLLTHLGYQVDLLLGRHGLTIDDVEKVNLPPPAAVGAMISGTIDVLSEGEPFLSQHLERGDTVLWAGGPELTPGYLHSVMMFGPDLLDERPDVGLRFAAAMQRAMAQFAEGRTERNMEIAAAATGQGHEVLERACWPVAPAGGQIATPGLRAYQEWSVARGLSDRVLSDEEIIDRRFFGAATADGLDHR